MLSKGEPSYVQRREGGHRWTAIYRVAFGGSRETGTPNEGHYCVWQSLDCPRLQATVLLSPVISVLVQSSLQMPVCVQPSVKEMQEEAERKDSRMGGRKLSQFPP